MRSFCRTWDTHSTRDICKPRFFTRGQCTQRTSSTAPIVVLHLLASYIRIPSTKACSGRPFRDHVLFALRHSRSQPSSHQEMSTHSRAVAVDQQGQVRILHLAQKMLRHPNQAFSLVICLLVPGAADHIVKTIGGCKGGKLPQTKLWPVVRRWLCQSVQICFSFPQ